MRLMLPDQLLARTTIRKNSWTQHTKDPKCAPNTDKTIEHGCKWHLMHCCQNIADSQMIETGFDLSSAWRNLESGEARRQCGSMVQQNTRLHRDPCLTDGARNHKRHCCNTSWAVFSQTDCFPHFATTLTNNDCVEQHVCASRQSIHAYHKYAKNAYRTKRAFTKMNVETHCGLEIPLRPVCTCITSFIQLILDAC